MSEIHKAAPGQDEYHCGVCGQRIKRVPGGQGPTYVHSDSGAVAAPSPRAPQAVVVSPEDVTPQELRALQKYVDGRGPSRLPEVVQYIIDTLKAGNAVSIIGG